MEEGTHFNQSAFLVNANNAIGPAPTQIVVPATPVQSFVNLNQLFVCNSPAEYNNVANQPVNPAVFAQYQVGNINSLGSLNNGIEWPPMLANTVLLANNTNFENVSRGSTDMATSSNNANVYQVMQTELPVCTLVGTLKLWTSCISEQFYKMVTRKDGYYKIMPLEQVSKKSTIRRADVNLKSPGPHDKILLYAIDRVIRSEIFKDWLILKCEACKTVFTKLSDLVEIFSVNSFEGLKNLVYQTSCFPFPVIGVEDTGNRTYYFATFKQNVNSKVSKLNSKVFFDVEKNQDVLVSCDFGIQMSAGYEQKMNVFILAFGTHLLSYIKQHGSKVCSYITYFHVIWGFLQNWIRKIAKSYSNCYTSGVIAENLILESLPPGQKKPVISIDRRSTVAYSLGYVKDRFLYLTFAPTNISEKKGNRISIANVESQLASSEPVVQYYRQFFYIHNEKNEVALRLILEYLKHSNCADSGEEHKETAKPSQQQNKTSFVSSEVPSQTFSTPAAPAALPARPAPTKPLLKARTVEEINSMVLPRVEQLEQPVKEKKVKETPNINYFSLVNQGLVSKEEIKRVLLPFVKESLSHCFSIRSMAVAIDETSVPAGMENRFNEVVASANKDGTFLQFLQQVYLGLQKYYTSATSQKIMNRFIYGDLKQKYDNDEIYLSTSAEGQICGQQGEETEKLIERLRGSMRQLLETTSEQQGVVNAECRRFKIAPCSVLLNRADIDNYLKRRKAKRKWPGTSGEPCPALEVPELSFPIKRELEEDPPAKRRCWDDLRRFDRLVALDANQNLKKKRSLNVKLVRLEDWITAEKCKVLGIKLELKPNLSADRHSEEESSHEGETSPALSSAEAQEKPKGDLNSLDEENVFVTKKRTRRKGLTLLEKWLHRGKVNRSEETETSKSGGCNQEKESAPIGLTKNTSRVSFKSNEKINSFAENSCDKPSNSISVGESNQSQQASEKLRDSQTTCRKLLPKRKTSHESESESCQQKTAPAATPTTAASASTASTISETLSLPMTMTAAPAISATTAKTAAALATIAENNASPLKGAITKDVLSTSTLEEEDSLRLKVTTQEKPNTEQKHILNAGITTAEKDSLCSNPASNQTSGSRCFLSPEHSTSSGSNVEVEKNVVRTNSFTERIISEESSVALSQIECPQKNRLESNATDKGQVSRLSVIIGEKNCVKETAVGVEIGKESSTFEETICVQQSAEGEGRTCNRQSSTVEKICSFDRKDDSLGRSLIEKESRRSSFSSEDREVFQFNATTEARSATERRNSLQRNPISDQEDHSQRNAAIKKNNLEPSRTPQDSDNLQAVTTAKSNQNVTVGKHYQPNSVFEKENKLQLNVADQTNRHHSSVAIEKTSSKSAPAARRNSVCKTLADEGRSDLQSKAVETEFSHQASGAADRRKCDVQSLATEKGSNKAGEKESSVQRVAVSDKRSDLQGRTRERRNSSPQRAYDRRSFDPQRRTPERINSSPWKAGNGRRNSDSQKRIQRGWNGDQWSARYDRRNSDSQCRTPERSNSPRRKTADRSGTKSATSERRDSEHRSDVAYRRSSGWQSRTPEGRDGGARRDGGDRSCAKDAMLEGLNGDAHKAAVENDNPLLAMSAAVVKNIFRSYTESRAVKEDGLQSKDSEKQGDNVRPKTSDKDDVQSKTDERNRLETSSAFETNGAVQGSSTTNKNSSPSSISVDSNPQTGPEDAAVDVSPANTSDTENNLKPNSGTECNVLRSVFDFGENSLEAQLPEYEEERTFEDDQETVIYDLEKDLDDLEIEILEVVEKCKDYQCKMKAENKLDVVDVVDDSGSDLEVLQCNVSIDKKTEENAKPKSFTDEKVNKPCFKCDICQKSFRKQRKMDEHILKKHKAKWQKKYCKLCNLRCPDEKSFEIHLKSKGHKKKILQLVSL